MFLLEAALKETLRLRSPAIEHDRICVKGKFFYETCQKIFSPMVGKLNLNFITGIKTEPYQLF